jgi:hypothetical protein
MIFYVAWIYLFIIKSTYSHFACGKPVDNYKFSVEKQAISGDNLGVNVENF